MRFFWIACTILIWTCPLLGQEVPAITQFSKTTYQAQNQNWSIAQLPNGMLAVANSAGMLLYDGYRWSLFPMTGNQVVRTVAVDAAGRIFCGGYGSFGYWEGDKKGQLQYTDLSQKIPTSKAGTEEIWNIIVLPDKVIFQSFSELFLYDYHQTTLLSPPANMMFLSKVGERIFVPTIEQGIFELTANNQFKVLEGTAALATKRVAGILPFGKDGLLIGTQKSGLFLYKNGQIQPFQNPINAALKENQLNRLLQLKNGQLVFGSILNGVYITDSTGEQLLFHLNNENGLQNNTILSLLEDTSNNLWVGMDKGIDYVQLNDKLVYYNNQQLNIGTLYSAVQYRGKLFVGTNQGIFYKKLKSSAFDFQSNIFQLIPGSQGQVWQLNVFDNQLIAGHNFGTYLIENEQLTFISNLTGGWFTIPVPSHPNLLLQSTYTGIALFKKGAKGRWILSHKLNGFAGPIKKILFDKKGNLWGINPHKGLFLFKLSTDFTQIDTVQQLTKKEGLPTPFRPNIFLIGERVIIESNQQFFQYDYSTQQLKRVQRIDGVDLTAGDYTVQFFSPQEYFKIFPTYIEWYFNGQKTKLEIPLVPNYEQIIPFADSQRLFCLDIGYALANPPISNHQNERETTTLFSEIIINGNHSIYPVFQSNPFEKWEFAPAENQLQFFIAQPYFDNQPDLVYQLVGFQNGWLPFKSNPKEFTNLPSGDFEFQVKTKENSTIHTFAFSILPKWYHTIWAKAVYTVLFFSLFWLIFIWSERRFKIQVENLELEKEKEFQQELTKARNDQLQQDLLNKSKELANSTMNLVQKNEILIKIKQELTSLKTKLSENTSSRAHQKLIHLVDHHLSNDKDWALFEKNFSQVHDSFFKKLKQEYPELTPGDLKLAAYLKMNLTSKEIAPLLNISIRGVENKRYRLRSKLKLASNDNLIEYMMRY